MSENIIETKNIIRTFKTAGNESFTALNDISVEIPAGCLTILKGRSGSGKTTLMNILGTLDKPTDGKILWDGKDITDISERRGEIMRRSLMGFVFQSVSLIPMMTVYENVEFALRLSGKKENMKDRVLECLKYVGLEKRINHMPAQLSGGEQQRVAIARAIAHKPHVVFADEPTAELDTATSHNIINLFKRLVREEKITIVMTTHDMSLLNAGDRIYELSDGKLIKGE